MIESDSQLRPKPLEEYEQLISLAEKSSESIDMLEDFYEKISYRLNLYVMLAAAFATLSLLFLSGLTSYYPEIPLLTMPLSIAVGSLATVLFIFTLFNIVKISHHRRHHYRQLYVELEIHHDLINIIEQQKRRVIATGALSPVKQALFEMRIKRLQRNKM